MMLPLLLATTITYLGTTSGSSTQTPSNASGNCHQDSPSPDRAYTWTAEATGLARASTCNPGTEFDTLLYIRRGACPGLDQIGCNDDDDNCATNASTVEWQAQEGSSWCVIVEGYKSTDFGKFELTIVGQSRSACWPTKAWGQSTQTCSAAAARVACSCSESFSWGPVSGADEYRIYERPTGGTWVTVGSLKVSPPWDDEDGHHPEAHPATWFFAKGPVRPEGAQFEYSVKACKQGTCSSGALLVSYTWAPYEEFP